ncbi:hypothetical protein PMAYCL1PPCAC_00342 [Pristionchus mayeri]|uniref:Fibrinogen C-terminal domain-containing protein n=1 Tax=Pristionchus mayeri TaxID=1317129 RepID=A0AAN4Z2G4_9BILA|nr:hypothetical protein PMAYCL1PPCAC_00342 [Pristionchus mayeri]
MRAAYHSEYRPGAADTSELDPCIAAETRLKKSAFSTSKKRTFCVIGVLGVIFLIFIVLLVLFLSGSSGNPSNIHTVGGFDYEDMQSATLVRKPPPPPDQPPTTTETTTVSTTARPSPPSTTRSTTRRPPTTPRPPPKMGNEIVIGRDEQPKEILRVNLPVERRLPPVTTTSTTTTTTTSTPPSTTKTTTSRPTLRTRPSSVFPTVPLREEEPYERKTETVRESCEAHAFAALGSGVYLVAPEITDVPFDVYCRMDEDDVVGRAEGVDRAAGAWTYVQSLSEEAYFYNRTFVEYQEGFGRVDKSHWLGLDAIHKLAPGSVLKRPATLRIELYGDHCSDSAHCSGRPDGFWWGEWEFGLASGDDLYRLHISPSLHGNLSVHNSKDVFYEMNNGNQFSTADRDNDRDEFVNCGQHRNYGGWWHKDCTFVALNGMYGDTKNKLRYQVWYRATMAGDPLKSSYHIRPKRSIMMVRQRL